MWREWEGTGRRGGSGNIDWLFVCLFFNKNTKLRIEPAKARSIIFLVALQETWPLVFWIMGIAWEYLLL